MDSGYDSKMVAKPKKPMVSVIIPNYNHARFLRKRIESVLRQRYQNFEVILMDDCSTDESRSIITEYTSDPRIKVDFNEKNSGSTFKQWNKGVRLARGEYVWIAESDDYADERLLERLVALLDQESMVTFAYCRSHRVTVEDHLDGFADSYLDGLHPERWRGDFCVDGREECRNYFVLTNPVPNASAVVFRKAAYEGVGGADESMHTCGDWKLWAALALAGKVSYLGEPLNFFRFHDKSVRSQCEQVGLDTAENLQVVRWILDRVKPTEVVLQKARLQAAYYWIPTVLGRRAPLGRRLEILRNAMAIDPHAMRKPVRRALAKLRREFLRHWRGIRSART
jgi:glycosyltransferase involved in cell wall biosynthesis